VTGRKKRKMLYFKKVEAGNYKKYAEDFLLYFIRNRNDLSKFSYIPNNVFWNAFKEEHYETYLDENPIFREGLSRFGRINEISLLILRGDTSTLHVDHETGANVGVKARLNIPILNCEGSYTEFFKFPEEVYNQHEVNAGKTLYWSNEIRNTQKPVTVVELIQPTILRTSEPHTVRCSHCKFPRISLTISFEDDVVKYLDEA
jgi:hypothetical protein